MEEKCPKCGKPLITRTIKKQLGHGSIEYPVAMVCQNCNWSRDLTGAGDIVAKPLLPEESEAIKKEKPPVVAPAKTPSVSLPMDINKIITIAMAVLVVGAIIWAFYPSGDDQTGPGGAQPTVTATPNPTATQSPEVTPTGKKVPMRLFYNREFGPSTLKINPGDEVVWQNQDQDTVFLISSDGLFETKMVPYLNRVSHVFNKTGTYTFYLKHNKNLTGTVIVEEP